MEEVNKCDKDTKLLTYKILMDKFNGKYDDLATNQKLILKEYINSIDNAPRLKEFYAGKINEIRENLKDLNNVPPKNYKLKDKDLVDLLQYCDLLEELEIANG